MDQKKFRAKEDTRVFVLGRNKRTIFIISLEKGQLFQLRRGQSFYDEKPAALKETLW